MSPSFLNLETTRKMGCSLSSVINEMGCHSSTAGVLTVITEFYTDLYSCQDKYSKEEIGKFLDDILSLPKVKQDTSQLIQSIGKEEIEAAIKSLRPMKAPGCDGLTSEFYKAFEELLIPILVEVFAQIWKDEKLSDTQHIAIIILLFKKGDSRLLSNYRPISLTNADYKILAYVLSHHLADHLTDVIAVNQTAYMSGQFIGTNIRLVQDMMSFFAKSSPGSVILFLDYTKAFALIVYLTNFIFVF